MKYYISFLIIIFSQLLLCQDSISVLFIGNSYTYTYDLPNVFKNLSNSLGDGVFVDSKTNGGFTFQNHVNDPITFQKIKSNLWDYVVIQGQSQEPSFPYNQVNSSTLPYAVQLADSVNSNYLCSQVNYFMTWGRQNGDPQWDSINTFDKMNLRLRNAYLRFADSAQASVTPAGVAWKYVRDNFPSINLFSSDGSHPSLAGTYLNACTFYATLFHKSPVGASFFGGLDQVTAEILQNVSQTIVFDSIQTWKLKHHDSLVYVDFTFSELSNNEFQFNPTSNYVTDYYWEFGDDSSSSNYNPSHVYDLPGTYDILLIGSSECGIDTAFQVITINTNTITKNDLNEIELSSLKENLILIKSNSDIPYESIQLIDLMGRNIDFKLSVKKSNELILKTNYNGVLIVKIHNNSLHFTKSIFVFE